MLNQKVFKYNNFDISECEINSNDDINDISENDFDIVKLIINPKNCDVVDMEKRGYMFADRTIETSIPLSHQDNLEKFIRLPIVETDEYKDELFQIASKSFPYDRRFHLKKQYNQELADTVIKDWIYKLDKSLVCFYKKIPIGFLSLKQIDEKNNFVHLAAVDEKYRYTGAAMALYSKAIINSKMRFQSGGGEFTRKNKLKEY